MAQHPATQLSLKRLRADPRFTLVAVVEKWNPHARIRQDLFGIIDIVAIGPDITMAVQCTSAGGFPARMKKLREHDSTRKVLDAGWLIEVHGWEKVKNRWTLKRCKEFRVADQPEGDE